MYKDINFKKLGFNVKNIGFFKVSKLGIVYRIDILDHGKLKPVNCSGGDYTYPYFNYFGKKIKIVNVMVSHYLDLNYNKINISFRDNNRKNTRLDNIFYTIKDS
ncbi:hypothetical protein RJI07_00665 [Mycoplasmatota bacterium WC30]